MADATRGRSDGPQPDARPDDPESLIAAGNVFRWPGHERCAVPPGLDERDAEPARGEGIAHRLGIRAEGVRVVAEQLAPREEAPDRQLVENRIGAHDRPGRLLCAG